jgi:ubiquinone/menaquinone biosynthesis C-methylase UbiE
MNCDRITPWYRWLEYLSFGSALQRRRCCFLSQIGNAQRVLMLGEGDGRFLAEFVAQNPTAEIDYVDASAKMLRLADGRANGSSKVRLHRRDLLTESLPGANYDLIVAHFFLDCFSDDQVTQVVGMISAAAAPSARWVVSEFREPREGWQKWRARVWVRGLYLGFRIMTGLQTKRLPEYGMALRAAGFEIQSEEIASAGLLVSQMWVRGWRGDRSHLNTESAEKERTQNSFNQIVRAELRSA